MPGRVLLALSFALTLVVAPCSVAIVSAQEAPPLDLTSARAELLNSAGAGGAFHFPPVPRATHRSSWLGALYVTTATMQGLDLHSTLAAFRSGAVEGNPLVAGLVKNRWAFIGLKAGVATSTILASRGMAKRSKVTAAVTLLAINSAYAVVVAHNYHLARAR